MLLSRKLINRYVDCADIPTSVLADTLTKAGFEVEAVSALVQGTHLTIGYVTECTMHPESDHLSVCQVDVGSAILQIVCGAPNVAQGQKVVVAQVGAALPHITIKKTTIRGLESNGMICSLSELGVAEKFQTEEQKTGIVVLETGDIGSDPQIALGLDDAILDIGLTPNRADFLSVFSACHEISGLVQRALTLPQFSEAATTGVSTKLTVHSQTPLCHQFLGKVIGKVTLKPSPPWIKAALIGSNIRPINNVVDISNLVMLETGQPLHFYDFDFLKHQSLDVRDDLSGEVLALDGETYAVEKGDALIMNGDLPVGIAGIMGLGNSMIHEQTRGIIIEAAQFDRVAIRKTAQRLGISSESSIRYSKPMDGLAAQQALDRAVQLLIEYADADAIEETAKFNPYTYDPIKITITSDRINRYLGTDLADETIIAVFDRLNFKPVVSAGIIECTVPSYRQDLYLDVDLIEEVIRVVGYDILSETLPKIDLTLGTLDEGQRNIRLIEATLLGAGAYQTNTYTLVDEASTQGMESVNNPIKLLSPLSDKRAYLRTSLYPSLLEVLAYNHAHRQEGGLYFEHSSIYSTEGTTHRLALIGSQKLFKDNWTQAGITLDFYGLKGILVNLFDQLGYQERRFEFLAKEVDGQLMHPYRSASIYLNRKRIGVIGHLHPSVLKSVNIKDCVYAEIDLNELFSQRGSATKYTQFESFPTVKRDLAVLCDDDLAVSSLIKTIEKASRRLLVDLNVFDVFSNAEMEQQQSIAFELTFGTTHTLSMDEINEIMTAITNQLTQQHGVHIR